MSDTDNKKSESEYIYRKKVDRLLDGLASRLSSESEEESERRQDAVNTMSESVGRVAKRVEKVREEVEKLKQKSAEFQLKIEALGSNASRTNAEVSILKQDYKEGAKSIDATLLRFTEVFADLAANIGIMSVDVGNMKSMREKDSMNISELYKKHDTEVEEERAELKEQIKVQLKRRHAWALVMVTIASPVLFWVVKYLWFGNG